MSGKVIEVNPNYTIERRDITLNKRTTEILNKLDKLYGIEKCKDVIYNYTKYIALKEKKKITFGTYNILIENASAYDSSKQLIEIIYGILKSEKIITTSYKYLDRDDFKSDRCKKDKKDREEIKEDLIIIDSEILDTRIINYKREIIELMTEFPKKIYVLINNDTNAGGRDGFYNANFDGYITWTMEIERISKENKIDYIRKFLKRNHINLAKGNTFEDTLSEEPFWKVKEELVNATLECKIKNIKEITDEVVSKELNKNYYKKCKEDENEQTAMQELNSMIGMEAVKKQVEQIINYIKINKERGKMPTLHMCFLGKPGTGKTTVARIVGRIFAEMKLLSKEDKFVEIHGRDLIAKYVGWTANETKKKIKEAEGGVLFIDEAYSLNPRDHRGFEDEAIATLIKEMEDKRDKVCVILAGYTNETLELLDANPGFESRIQFKINFPDYSEDELYEIFKSMAKKEKYKITANVKSVLIPYFEQEKLKENFANARCVRNIFEKIKFEQADRVVKSEEDINTIKKEDALNAIKKSSRKVKIKQRIGFCN